MFLIPQDNQIIAALADILLVLDSPPKCTISIERTYNALVYLDLYLKVTIQVYAGGINGDAGMHRATI